MKSNFEKDVVFWSVVSPPPPKYLFCEWGRRERSLRESSAKITAAMFSRCDFLYGFGGGE